MQDFNQQPETVLTPAAELGGELRRLREHRQLSVGEVSERLKLPARQIEALEAGDYASMPEPVFVRGFLRSYGRFLEMDESALNGFLAQISTTPQPPVRNTDLNFTNSELRKSFPTWIFGVLAAAILGAGVYLWQGKSQTDYARKAEEEAAAPIAAAQEGAAATAQLNGGNAVTVAMPASETAALETAAPASAASAVAVQTGEMVIVPRYRTMLTVTDGKGEVLLNQIVPARSEHRFHSGAPYEVRLGYAIGATVTFNGAVQNVERHRKGKSAVLTVGAADEAATSAVSAVFPSAASVPAASAVFH